MNVLKDIKTGALPLNEIPGYLIWLLARLFWPLVSVSAIGFIYVLIARGHNAP